MEDAIRSVGGLLQLAGVGCVGWGVARTRREAKEILGFLGTIRPLIRPLFRIFRRTKPVVVQARPANARAHGGSATIKVTPSWDQLSPDQRDAWLRDELREVETKLGDLLSELRKEARERQDADQREHAERIQAFQALDDRVESFAGLNLRLEAIGAVLFALGIIATTWAQEIARVPG